MRQVSWSEIEKCCKNLLEKIRKSGKQYVSIYGIPRGGLIPAVYLSHHLNIPLSPNPKWGSLVIDDINDSGQTLYDISTKIGVDTAVLFERTDSKMAADYISDKIDSNDWLIFPWESREEAFKDMMDYLKDNKDAVHQTRR